MMEETMTNETNNKIKILSLLSHRNTRIGCIVCAVLSALVVMTVARSAFVADGMSEQHPVMKIAAHTPRRPVVATQSRVGYDRSVLSAMRDTGVTVADFNAWIEQHPETTIRRLKYMPVTMQREVASTAIFIRKANPRLDAKTAWREAAAIAHFSSKYGVPSMLATAVAHTESTFDPNALSKKGASGVMQVMWRLHNPLLKANGIVSSGGPNPLADPEQAIAAGCLLLSRFLRAYGTVASAMEKYYGARSTTYQDKIDRTLAMLMDHHDTFGR